MGKFSDKEAFNLLKKYKIPIVKQIITKHEGKAIDFAKKIGYPVVLKLSSPTIVHKTDSKAVLVGIEDEKDLKEGFRKLINIGKRKKAKIDGIIVQKQIKGHEIIIGSSRDLQFGPTILFGLGGIFVEVLKDVALRLIPIERKDAREMIREIKGYKVLAGIRGGKSINFHSLEDCLLKVSKMVWSEKSRPIKELDINPLFADEKGVLAVDVRVFV